MNKEYTFEDYWKETYNNEPSIWNAPLEMYNKAKKDYRQLLIAEGEREQARRAFYED